MIHRWLFLLATFIVICLSVGLAPAQSRETQREKAYQLLETLAGQITSLRSAENRARLGSNIAESLWDRDEKRARSLFASVADDINAGLAQAQGHELEDEKTRMVFLHLRFDTIKRIVKHDPTFALEFMKSTEPPEKVRSLYRFSSMERDLELDLARAAATNSPEIALTFGRRELERGFSGELLDVLAKLIKKHREDGVAFYQEIVLKLRDHDMENDWEATNFALALVGSYSPPAVNEAAFRELVNLLIRIATARGCTGKMEEDDEPWFCTRIASVLPQIEKVDPGRASALKRWASEPSESTWSSEGYQELRETYQLGTVDDLLGLVTTYPRLEREIYLAAVRKALEEGDLERARRVAADYQGNPDTRAAISRELAGLEEAAARKDEILQDIQNKLGTINDARSQVMMLLFAASQFGLIDQKAASKLLNQANEIANSMKAGKEQTELQMAMAGLYCMQKNDRGLSLMESLMPRLNALVAAAGELDGYENHYLREGEWNMSSEGGLGQLLTSLANNAGAFAWCDFDRAVSTAGQFERAELRLMAQLKLAQSILAGPPPRRLLRRGGF